jgi:hypothetical protein
VPWNGSLTAGKAVVNDTGLVVAVKPGSVTVRAATIDGSGVYRDFALMVLPTGTATGISVYSETGQYSIEIGKSLQLIAEIEPVTAYQVAKWEVREDSPNATVSVDGLVIGNVLGETMIRCTTLDGMTLADSVKITVTSAVLPDDTVTQQIGEGYYLTYQFGDTQWMIENSKEGTKAATSYGGAGNEYYYTHANKLTACPDPWKLPTQQQGRNLQTYLSQFGSSEEWNAWFMTGMTGRYRDTVGWENRGYNSFYWLAEEYEYIIMRNNSFAFDRWGAVLYQTVRCVHTGT